MWKIIFDAIKNLEAFLPLSFLNKYLYRYISMAYTFFSGITVSVNIFNNIEKLSLLKLLGSLFLISLSILIVVVFIRFVFNTIRFDNYVDVVRSCCGRNSDHCLCGYQMFSKDTKPRSGLETYSPKEDKV